jgi:hypothetical protein
MKYLIMLLALSGCASYAPYWDDTRQRPIEKQQEDLLFCKRYGYATTSNNAGASAVFENCMQERGFVLKVTEVE